MICILGVEHRLPPMLSMVLQHVGGQFHLFLFRAIHHPKLLLHLSNPKIYSIWLTPSLEICGNQPQETIQTRRPLRAASRATFVCICSNPCTACNNMPTSPFLAPSPCSPPSYGGGSLTALLGSMILFQTGHPLATQIQIKQSHAHITETQ